MEKHISREGCNIAYEYVPGSRPVTVILVHGYGLHRAMWRPQVEFLRSEGYPVINIDVRGHGNSRPTGKFSVKLAAEDIHAVIEAERPEHYLLCGLSMGAFAVQEYAFLFGDAAGYMLTGVTPLCIPYPAWEKTLLAYSGPIMKHFYSWPRLKKAMSKGCAFTKPASLCVGRMFEEIEQEEFLVSWAGFTTCLHEETLTFDAPLLVTAGEQDTRGTIKKHLADWHTHYPGCIVKTISNAGHVANLDQPEQFNELLLSFITACESARSRLS
ncbi:MAG: alpha/beta hydrolase [Clostridiales Family XIII bacterium]|jgi:pimeloyl-ACP methyl ester carboxylesterase|nr:alpha/beta hydrolase [Clostridiales Family XIII bacterium]